MWTIKAFRRGSARRFVGALAVAMLGVLMGGAVVAAPSEDQLVRFVTAVEQAKGHLLSSRELYDLGQPERASLHSSHPIHELGNRIVGPIKLVNPELAERVRGMLKGPSRAIEAKVSAPEYATLIDAVYALLDEGVQAAVPADLLITPLFQARVLKALLNAGAEEYGEAVKGGKIVRVVEYQDAYGFYRRSVAIREQMGAAAPSGLGPEWTRLAQVFPGVVPPPRAASPSEITALTKKVAAALARGPDTGRSPGQR